MLTTHNRRQLRHYCLGTAGLAPISGRPHNEFVNARNTYNGPLPGNTTGSCADAAHLHFPELGRLTREEAGVQFQALLTGLKQKMALNAAQRNSTWSANGDVQPMAA